MEFPDVMEEELGCSVRATGVKLQEIPQLIIIYGI